ncbi:MAG: carbohydrate-binding protein, partial [Acidobacteria bacterium]|nr:carbohydrate-binding protein [Acidobacteriota bacterium]
MTSPTLWLRRRPPPTPEKPLRDELLSMERLEERALALAASLTVDPSPRHRARDTFPRFEDNVRVLRHAYRTLAEDVRTGQFVVSAADWLLDNFHLITAEISDIRRNLPRTYSRTLPALASRSHVGNARIYAIAVELIRHSDSRLHRHQLIQFLTSYQRVAPLTIGELWAWPSMLKLALIENLRRLAEELMAARAERLAADEYVQRADEGRIVTAIPGHADTAFIAHLLHRVREYGVRLSPLRLAVDEHLALRQTTAEDTIRGEHQRQGVAQVSVANAITSLRLCATLDWQEYVEAVSLVETVLQRDPAGAYGRMDFLSRD